QLHAMGRTVLISSHILTEMTDFCTSIGILEQGRLLASGRVDDILKRLQPALRLEIEVVNGAERLEAILKTFPVVQHVEVAPHRIACQWHAERCALPELHRRLVSEGVELISLAVKTDNLEDIYMKISGHKTS